LMKTLQCTSKRKPAGHSSKSSIVNQNYAVVLS
jgi:hypothetical protein